ncbi:putative PPM-type phosphatase domain-containing protein [uncultured Gammaproteobacteria bacterium]
MRFTVTDIATDAAGPGVNEDIAGHTGDEEWGAAWVIDGATGLAGREFVPGAASDARWLAERLNAGFVALSLVPVFPQVVCRRVLERVRAAFWAAVGAIDLPARVRPSAAGVWVRWQGQSGRLEQFGLADCKAIYRTGEGATVILGRRGRGGLDCADAAVNAAVSRFHAQGVTDPAEIRRQLTAPILEGRTAMNRPGGYWAFGLEPEAADHLDQDCHMLAAPAVLLLVSDGFYRLVDTYHVYDSADALVAAAVRDGLAALVLQLRQIEGDDPNCSRFPRLKPTDDATALLIAIED